MRTVVEACVQTATRAIALPWHPERSEIERHEALAGEPHQNCRRCEERPERNRRLAVGVRALEENHAVHAPGKSCHEQHGKKIGRASCRGKSVELGGRRIMKKKKKANKRTHQKRRA